MGLFNMFPFTNFHELNLDWIIKTMKETVTAFNTLESETKDKLSAQDAQITAFAKKYSQKVDEIPTLVRNNTETIMDGWKNDGSMQILIEETYGAVSYLNKLQSQKIVVLGDSLSDGSRSQSWVNTLSTKLKSTNCKITNLAKSNAKLSEQADAFVANTVNPDILIVWCGINDVRDQTSLADMRTALNKIRSNVQSKNPKCQVYLFSTYKNKRGLPSSWSIPQVAYWRLYWQYAQQNGWTFVDLFSQAPVITTETDTMLRTFYTESGSGYLHYTQQYSEILASYIMYLMITGTGVPIGDYYERVDGTNLSNVSSPVTSVFTINTNGSFVDFGTRFVHVRVAGVFKAPSSSKRYTQICTLPYFCRPHDNNNFTMAYRAGGTTSDGGDYSLKALLNADGSLYLYNLINETQAQATSMTVYIDFWLDNLLTDWERTQA